MILVKTIQVSSGQLGNTSSAHCFVGSPPKGQSPARPVHPALPASHLWPALAYALESRTAGFGRTDSEGLPGKHLLVKVRAETRVQRS